MVILGKERRKIPPWQALIASYPEMGNFDISSKWAPEVATKFGALQCSKGIQQSECVGMQNTQRTLDSVIRIGLLLKSFTLRGQWLVRARLVAQLSIR